jgi:hypothetical protein
MGRRRHGLLYEYPQNARRTFHDVCVLDILSFFLSPFGVVLSYSVPWPTSEHRRLHIAHGERSSQPGVQNPHVGLTVYTCAFMINPAMWLHDSALDILSSFHFLRFRIYQLGRSSPLLPLVRVLMCFKQCVSRSLRTTARLSSCLERHHQ